ncbi:CHAP domain-containing protein [Lactovum odontotermitis]
MSGFKLLEHWKFWSILFSLIFLVPLSLLLAIASEWMMTFSVIGGGGNQAQAASSGSRGITYVKHWLGEDAYHSHFLGHRYGITAEQVDGFIASEGYKNLGERASGTAFLQLQAQSGIDVRVLVAFAQVESQFGQAVPGNQNMFGYGAFDSNPGNAANYADEASVKDFRSYQIDTLGNTSCYIDDQRALQYSQGTLPAGSGVYWTGLNSGQTRAAIMEKFDTYIDKHGGTPAPPNGYGPATGTGSILGNGKGNIAFLDAQLGQILGSGQCYGLTSYYVRQLTNGKYSLGAGISGSFPPLLNGNTVDAWAIGEAYNWSILGWVTNLSPSYSDVKEGDIINFKGGPYDAVNGHTAIVGAVLENQQLVIYTQNPTPVIAQTVSWGNVTSLVHPPNHS